MACCPQDNANFPAKATAGLSFSALVSVADYPVPEWALVAYIRGPKSIDLTSTPEGSDHRFTADAETTADWPAGAYWYSLRAINGADVREIETGTLQVLPDITAAGDGYDGRSNAQIALDAINAVLEKRATLDQERYRINNRELYRTSISDLLKLRAFYAGQVKRECARNAGRSKFGRQVLVRFS